MGEMNEQALMARPSPERGADGLCHALVHGWQNWDKVKTIGNPTWYLYRIGTTRARRRADGLPAP